MKKQTIELIDQQIAALVARRKARVRDLRQEEAQLSRKAASMVGGHVLRLAASDPRARDLLAEIAAKAPPELQATIRAALETPEA